MSSGNRGPKWYLSRGGLSVIRQLMRYGGWGVGAGERVERGKIGLW